MPITSNYRNSKVRPNWKCRKLTRFLSSPFHITAMDGHKTFAEVVQRLEKVQIQEICHRMHVLCSE